MTTILTIDFINGDLDFARLTIDFINDDLDFDRFNDDFTISRRQPQPHADKSADFRLVVDREVEGPL